MVRLPMFLIGKEKEYLIENLSMLIASGMGILEALDSIKGELRSSRIIQTVQGIKEEIESGSPLWRALDKTKFFPARTISLVRIGEEAGKLSQNLKLIALQEEKERAFHSKIRSAMMYPVFVFCLTGIVGIGIAWFILPRLSLVFAQLKLQLPLVTRVLIATGEFLGEYGVIAVPLFLLFIFIVIFLLFFHKKTQWIGQTLLFTLPGIQKLIQEVELSRFGYLLGTLLAAGVPMVHAIGSLAEATPFRTYKRLYMHLREHIEDGDSFQKSFSSYRGIKKLLPLPIQQLIVAGERSGNLPETLLKIAETFEDKTETTAKNVTVILEPILLVVVWLGVVGVALAVILPIYNLIGGLNQGTSTVPATPPAETMPSMPPPSITTSTHLNILSTETGYLNVRNASALSGEIIGKVLPGETYEYIDEQNGWYKIILSGKEQGWVLGQYVNIIKAENR